MLIPFLLLFSIPLLSNVDSNEAPIESFHENVEYKTIESYDLHFEPGQECPCKNDELHEMKLVYFEWVHPEKDGKQLARYLISKTYLDEGSFGRIYHATMISYPENKPRECVAIKMASTNSKFTLKKTQAMIDREIDVIKSVSTGTKHIIGYAPSHNYFMVNEYEKHQAIVMQIGSEFAHYWGNEYGKYKSEKMMLEIVRQILIGIDEIHQRNFIHLDLKIGNVLKMPEEGIYLKLIDFGGAIELEDRQETKEVDSNDLQTTEQYTAPEINVPRILNLAYNRTIKIVVSKKADIWSFGIMILDMLSYFPALEVKAKNLIEFFHKNKKNEKLSEKFDEELNNFLAISKNDYKTISDILQSCLKWEPNERPTAEELIEKHFKNAETENNIDFFEDIVEYLDEQFNKISLKLAMVTGRLQPIQNDLSAKIHSKISDNEYENLFLAHQTHQNREGLQKKYSQRLEKSSLQKQKSPAENVLQNPHKNSQRDNLFSPKLKPHQFKEEMGSSSKDVPKNVRENKPTHHRSFSSPQNLITIQRPTFKKRHKSIDIDIHFHHKKSQSHEILIRHPASDTPKLHSLFAIRRNSRLGYPPLSPNKSKIKSEKHCEISREISSSSSSINEKEIQLEADFAKSKSPKNKSDVGTDTVVLPSSHSSPLHSMEQIRRKGFKFVTNIALGPGNY